MLCPCHGKWRVLVAGIHWPPRPPSAGRSCEIPPLPRVAHGCPRIASCSGLALSGRRLHERLRERVCYTRGGSMANVSMCVCVRVSFRLVE